MNKKIDNFYNKFSVIYPIVNLFLKSQKQKLFTEINSLPCGKLLDIGVGQGTHLRDYKTHKVTGIDVSLKMLTIAKKHQHTNIELVQMNGESLLYPKNTFDYIVIAHVITVVNNPEKLLEESYRVLKPNGKIFILNHFTPNNWLSYLDRSFQMVSKIFHFKSFFYIDSVTAIRKFKLLKEIDFGKLCYFKLLIYCKA